MKNFFYRYLLRKLLRNDLVLDMGEVEILATYNKMNNEPTLKLFRYLYTNILASLAVIKGVSKEEEDLVKGRLLQIAGMIDSIESAEDDLLRIKDIMERKEKRSKVLENIKNKLMFTKKKS